MIISTLLVTLANPHVYLDTVFLVGSAALNFSFDEKILFVLGALSASFLWFFSLGYGAKFLSSYIKSNIVKIIDLFACLIMCMVAYSLILYILERI
ncbi:LysE family transporter [Campylobacter upsaliensis]|uniref:LysE/ArgO family amino acid transporter n=1 Tax=Campylobacter upsaliensis TaxID=28080 RepID=UPI00214A2A8D|nr:LysE family transporter [Campylobacter upsaliensis]